jgi:hypothetical protein
LISICATSFVISLCLTLHVCVQTFDGIGVKKTRGTKHPLRFYLDPMIILTLEALNRQFKIDYCLANFIRKKYDPLIYWTTQASVRPRVYERLHLYLGRAKKTIHLALGRIRTHLQKWHPCIETAPACVRASIPPPRCHLRRAPSARPPSPALVSHCTRGPRRPSDKRGRAHGASDSEGSGRDVVWIPYWLRERQCSKR